MTDRRMRVKNSLRIWKGDDLCFQETKMEVINRVVVRSLWGTPFVDWEFLEAKGAFGVAHLWTGKLATSYFL